MRNRCSVWSAIRGGPVWVDWAASQRPAAAVTSASDGRSGSRSSPVRYAAIDLTPTADAVRVARAERTASAKPAAPIPAATTSSATRSSRTISCAVAPASPPSSAGEVIGSGVYPVSTHSADIPAATRNRLLTSVAPSSARRRT